MYPGAESSGRGEGPSSSSGGGGDVGATRQAAAAAAEHPTPSSPHQPGPPSQQRQPPSRYESQKRRDWNTFLQYLKSQKPPLSLARCGVAHVIGFLKYLDQFGKTKVHAAGCPYFGHPSPPAPCACPHMQAWGSLDALIGRFRAAYKENGGRPESNPFAAHAVRVYLREVRESQAKARGISYEKKKRKPNNIPPTVAPAAAQPSSSYGAGGGESSSPSAAAAGTSGTVEGAVAPPQKGLSLS